ncbi:hypothetical protein TNCV_526701 [Trichonephila clavipes]|nr:hypothetical protein TNCV_526701 [Trichonephila clavipes]
MGLKRYRDSKPTIRQNKAHNQIPIDYQGRSRGSGVILSWNSWRAMSSHRFESRLKISRVEGLTHTLNLSRLKILMLAWCAVEVNKILKFNHFPDNWKEAIIFPINKPGKDPHLATSYRPISLLSTIARWAANLSQLSLYQHPIREQPLSSQPCQKTLNISHPDEARLPRLPDSIDQPITAMPQSRM